jgi:hypothetical protein
VEAAVAEHNHWLLGALAEGEVEEEGTPWWSVSRGTFWGQKQK